MSSEAHRTLEGWYALHDVRSIDWGSWKRYTEEERAELILEATRFLEAAEAVEDAAAGSSAAFALLGHKGDLMLVHFRPSVDDLMRLELAFAQTALADLTERTYSYVSVTELGQYTSDESRERTSQEQAFITRRLEPQFPEYPYVSFYPMSKKREAGENWYSLDLETRRDLMYAHGAIGRAYRGRVQQIITGSMGLDDWEWGVTLLAVDALPIKKIVQEMRFDEASAKYGLFGPFFFGRRLRPADMAAYLSGRFTP